MFQGMSRSHPWRRLRELLGRNPTRYHKIQQAGCKPQSADASTTLQRLLPALPPPSQKCCWWIVVDSCWGWVLRLTSVGSVISWVFRLPNSLIYHLCPILILILHALVLECFSWFRHTGLYFKTFIGVSAVVSTLFFAEYSSSPAWAGDHDHSTDYTKLA